MALSNFTKVQTVGIGSNIEIVGVVTTGQFKTGTSNLHSTGVELTNLNVSGIATIGGSISIGGTLTYQDVTNVDSVGIITARDHVKLVTNNKKITFGSGSNLEIYSTGTDGVVNAASGDIKIQKGGSGLLTFKSTGSHFLADVLIADSIIHDGDTDTKIRFPAGNTITFETAGSERLRINSSGTVLFKGGDQSTDAIKVESESGGAAIHISNYRGVTDTGDSTRLGLGKNNNAMIFMNASGSQVDAFAIGNTDSVPLVFSTNNTERLRILGTGKVGIGTNNPATKCHIYDASADPYLKIGGSNRDCGIQLDAASNFTAMRTDAANRLFVNAGADSIRFSIGGTQSSNEKNRIDSSGISGNIKNNYALVALVTDRDDGSRSSGATSYQDDTGLVLTNAINYRHGDIFFVRVLVPIGIALVSTDTANYQGVYLRIKITPSSGTTRYSADTRGWYRHDGRATKETMQLVTCYYHLTASNTSQFNDNVNLSFQVQYHRDAGGVGSYGATGLSIWSGERTMEVWQFRKEL
tara:strand:- start:278 stop:1852 length:1575 start_codon:yes stop_codon:yes gene_type:complete